MKLSVKNPDKKMICLVLYNTKLLKGGMNN